MIENPENYIADFAKAGADIITVHVESTHHIHRAIQLIKNHGVKAGVVINPGTAIESIMPVLSEVDMVLVMTVNPGFGGQSFIKETVSKIALLDTLKKDKGYNFEIEVDGGISPETAKICKDAGATVFVAGSYIYDAQNPIERLTCLKDAIR